MTKAATCDVMGQYQSPELPAASTNQLEAIVENDSIIDRDEDYFHTNENYFVGKNRIEMTEPIEPALAIKRHVYT